MTQYLSQSIEWVGEHATISASLLVGSIVVLIGTLWAGHRFLVTIPPDYFQHDHKRLEILDGANPALRWSVIIAKNLLGGVLIVAGLVMLLTPGQGVLSILLGLVLVDVPGKRKLERKIIKRKSVLKVVNRLRARAGQKPLEF
jgi:hypothetical protein